MDDLRKLVRAILREAVAIGADGRMSSDDASGTDEVTLELVDDYIRQHRRPEFTFSAVGRYRDYFLPFEAKEYFDAIGFKQYRVAKLRSKAKKGAYVSGVMVAGWICSDMEGMHEVMEVHADGTVDKSWEHDSLEINHDLVTDYIRANRIGERKGIGFYADYELPLEAKEYFDAIGFQDYSKSFNGKPLN